MQSALVKQLTVVILALIGIADGIWGTQFLGSLTTEVITVIVTLALAALGIVEMRNAAEVAAKAKRPPQTTL